MVDKELIENCFRGVVKPFVMNFLLNTNYEGNGEIDGAGFERDFDEVLDLAIKALETKSCVDIGDVISRKAVKGLLCDNCDNWHCIRDCGRVKEVDSIPAEQVVSKGAYEQCKWERDMAVKQLAELGYSLGEKPQKRFGSPRKGHWIISSDGYYPYCSECKTEPGSGNMTDVCPTCGANMTP